MKEHGNLRAPRLLSVGGWAIVACAACLTILGLLLRSYWTVLGALGIAAAAWPLYRLPALVRVVGIVVIPVVLTIGFLLNNPADPISMTRDAITRQERRARWEVIEDSVLAAARAKLDAGEPAAARAILEPWRDRDPAVRELDREASDQLSRAERGGREE